MLVEMLNVIIRASSLRSVHVKFLDDSRSVLDHLRVTVRDVLSEGINNLTDSHLLKLLPALLVHTEVANGEQGDTSG